MSKEKRGMGALLAVVVLGLVGILAGLAGRAMGGGYGQPAGGVGPTPVLGRDSLPSMRGVPTPSDTFNQSDQGTDWPLDAFGAMTTGHQSPEPIDRPALNSYAGDGNMEALDVYGPFSQETADVANYTGGVGPSGRSTPEAHPEITAPGGTMQDVG